MNVKVTDGPLILNADVVNIEHKDGTESAHISSVALCACGQSSNKPFCDGSHKG